MKKITLYLLTLFTSYLSLGQQVLSHSVDNMNIMGDTVACANTNDNTTQDNIYYRSYTPSDFGFTGNFDILGGNFLFTFVDVSGGATVEVVLRFFTSDDIFPNGNLTEIASETLTLDVNSDFENLQGPVEVLLSELVTVNATTEIIIALDIPNNVEPVMFDARVGRNIAGQTAPGYLSTILCGIEAPVDIADIGAGASNIVLDLVGDTSLSTNDLNFANAVSLFPNPTNGDLNVNIARSLGNLEVHIINVNGQVVMTNAIETVGSTALATSRLANGVYFAQISSDEGSATLKFIKN